MVQIEVSQETFDVEVNDQLVAASYRTADVERVLLSLLDEAARLERERSARMAASHPAASASEAGSSSRSAAGSHQQLFSSNAKEPDPAAARTIVFLAAPPGAGKSTLAAVLERLAQGRPGMPRVQAVGMDGFHHTNTYLDRHTLDCPDGKPVSLRSIKGAPETFDVEGFALALHETRVSSDPVQWPAYSRVVHDVVADGPIVSAPIVIVEGNYLLLDEGPWRDLAELCDLSIFVEADEAMLRERLVARKVRGGLSCTEAERFFEQSDGKNVRRVLAHRRPADITMTLDSSGRMRRLEATPALAFFDIDGTLTWAKEGEADIDAAPTDAVRLALESFVARGNLAVLCTGRPLCNVPPALKTLPFAGMVTLAGGHVELDGEVVRDVGMPSDVVELLVSCCEQARVPAYFESSNRGVVLAWPGVFSLFDTFGEFSERVGIEELRGVLSGIDVGKVVFDSEHIELLTTMAPAITERCSVCNIGDGLYEVTVPGITKFDGMRAVWSALRERGVRIGTVYGFGDSENDGSMLSAVDVAVAMGNALPAVRTSADYVTDPVWDDGVATALEAFGLV
ncbi:nucleoside/nucleotide kinase family protein [Enorma massiliensis]|uniref:nucleoside/nucleotide kinase family protein n=1 Tax=Enorma massiliensis TaxID=1472761 RepID=UPI003AB483F9